MSPNAMQTPAENAPNIHVLSLVPTSRVLNFISANRTNDGAKALALLMRNPNTPLHCISLTHLISPPDIMITPCDDALPDPGDCLRKIPLSDHKTIKDIYKRLNHLIDTKSVLITLCQNEDNILYTKQLSDIDTEMSALKHYLGQCLRPGGYIRNFPDEERKASQRISLAIKRLLNRNAEQYPEAVAYLTKHLKMGLYFQYLE